MRVIIPALHASAFLLAAYRSVLLQSNCDLSMTCLAYSKSLKDQIKERVHFEEEKIQSLRRIASVYHQVLDLCLTPCEALT
jgi:hypothetical protein